MILDVMENVDCYMALNRGFIEAFGFLSRPDLKELPVGKYEIEDTRDLMRAVDRYEPGEEGDVKIIRDKKEKVLKVIFGEGKGRLRHHFSFEPERFEAYAPDIVIEIPEMDFEIPEIDLEEHFAEWEYLL